MPIGIRQKVVGALLARGLLAEIEALACRAGARPGTGAVSPSLRPGRSAAAGSGRKLREDTKQVQLTRMLHREKDATIAEIVAAIGCLPHTDRGAFAGTLKKRLGVRIVSEEVEGLGRKCA